MWILLCCLCGFWQDAAAPGTLPHQIVIFEPPELAALMDRIKELEEIQTQLLARGISMQQRLDALEAAVPPESPLSPETRQTLRELKEGQTRNRDDIRLLSGCVLLVFLLVLWLLADWGFMRASHKCRSVTNNPN